MASTELNAVTVRERGTALAKQGRFEEALASLDSDEAIRADADALNTRGMILTALGRLDEAMREFEQALAMRPDFADAINNCGTVHARRGHFELALPCYERSLAIAPDQVHARYNLSTTLLVLGDWTRGFREFETRWKLFPHEAVRLNRLKPVWLGQEDIRGKTVLLHHEQGYGDAIQFSRYAPLVAQRGARVILKALSNQAALVGGGGSSTLTGGAYPDFYAAGKVADQITTGATDNVVSVNMGDGSDTLQPTSGASNILSLGDGMDTEKLYFTKSSSNLLLTDGSGDTITFKNWYSGSADQDYVTLQVVEAASSSYDPNGSDPLRNEALEEFNFTTLVSEFNAAGSPSDWALSSGMPSAQLQGSASEAYGGDLAYYFGLDGDLTGLDLSAADATLTNSSFATAPQTIDPSSSVFGGGGIVLETMRAPLASSSGAGSTTLGATDTRSAATPPAPGETAALAATGPATSTASTSASPGSSDSTEKSSVVTPGAVAASLAASSPAPRDTTPERPVPHSTIGTAEEIPLLQGGYLPRPQDTPAIRLPYVDPVRLGWMAADDIVNRGDPALLSASSEGADESGISTEELLVGAAASRRLPEPRIGRPIGADRFRST
jgi:tetratricopeptide (TPR) repeat protein